ncbi:hypothetical protein [Treponema sp.]|uniref:hypothetical protein n=1 Tax=Treponema sp. TaxID=166 RepID=UPI003890A8FD
MKKNLRPSFSICFSVLLTLAGCASMPTDQYLAHLDSGEYNPCISYLEKKNKKKPGKDIIRDNFDVAMMKHYQKDYDSSLKILNETDRLMDDAVTQSISKGFASTFGNDNADEYKGNPYEYVYINIFNALNYYNKGDIEEAAVEVRRLNEKQQKYLNDYGEWISNSESQIEISDTYKKLSLDTKKLIASTPEKPTEADIFRDSATARYLSIVFANMDDSVNNSWNIKADSLTLKALNPSFDIECESQISDGMGRLDILAFTGLIGRRGERRIIAGPFPGIQFPAGKNFVYIPAFDLEFVYPEFPAPQTHLSPQVMPTFGWGPSFTIYPGKNEIIKMPDNQIEKITVTITNGKSLPNQTITLALLEDFNYAVQKDVHSKAQKAYSRSIKRSMAKKFTAVAGATATLIVAEEAVRRNENLLTVASYAAAYLSAAKAADQIDRTETADIRQVYALPSQSYAGGFELPEGTYSLKVQYFSKNGVILKEEKFSNINVKNGKSVLVEATCQK